MSMAKRYEFGVDEADADALEECGSLWLSSASCNHRCCPFCRVSAPRPHAALSLILTFGHGVAYPSFKFVIAATIAIMKAPAVTMNLPIVHAVWGSSYALLNQNPTTNAITRAIVLAMEIRVVD